MEYCRNFIILYNTNNESFCSLPLWQHLLGQCLSIAKPVAPFPFSTPTRTLNDFSSLICCHIENIYTCVSPLGPRSWESNTSNSPCVFTPSMFPFNFQLPPPVLLFSLLGHVSLQHLLFFFASLFSGLGYPTFHKGNKTRILFNDDLALVQILFLLSLCSFASSFSFFHSCLC